MRVLLSVALLGGVLLLAGCSGSPAPSGAAPTVTDAPTADKALDNALDNAQDTRFGADLLQLQQQAGTLAGLAQQRAANPELVNLARTIATGQRDESDTIKAFLVQWSDGSGPPAAPSTAVPGALDPATVTRLESLRGPQFDTLWLQSMTGLHRGAIRLAEAEISGGRNVDAQSLAKSILDTRQAQLQQMQQMVG